MLHLEYHLHLVSRHSLTCVCGSHLGVNPGWKIVASRCNALLTLLRHSHAHVVHVVLAHLAPHVQRLCVAIITLLSSIRSTCTFLEFLRLV